MVILPDATRAYHLHFMMVSPKIMALLSVLALSCGLLDLARRGHILTIKYGLMQLIHHGHLLFVLRKQVLLVDKRMRLLLRRHRGEDAIVEAEAHSVVSEELSTGFMLLLEQEMLVAAGVLGAGGGALIFVIVVAVVGRRTLFGAGALRFLVSAITGGDDAVVGHFLFLGGFVGSVDLNGLAAAVASLSLSLLGPNGLTSQFIHLGIFVIRPAVLRLLALVRNVGKV